MAVRPANIPVQSLEGSILSNFMLNHLFTFRNSVVGSSLRGLGGKLVAYNLVALAGASIAWVTFSAVTAIWGLHYALADILGIMIATGWNYWLNLKVVWPLVDNGPPEANAREPQNI